MQAGLTALPYALGRVAALRGLKIVVIVVQVALWGGRDVPSERALYSQPQRLRHVPPKGKQRLQAVLGHLPIAGIYPFTNTLLQHSVVTC